MNQHINELRLQRLVDGVLTDAERTEFLQSLEDRPEAWREVALAFVEEQIWAAAVGAAERPAVPRKPPAGAAHAVKRAFRWATLAACLLVAVGLGFGAGQWWTPKIQPRLADRPENTAIVRDLDGQVSPEAPAPEILASDEASLPQQLEIEYGDGPSRQSLTVPVVHESEMGGRVWRDPYAAEFERLNRQLARSGYQLEWRTEYLGGNLRGGNQLVVPVRAVALRRRGQ
jgi:hypothetical protein